MEDRRYSENLVVIAIESYILVVVVVKINSVKYFENESTINQTFWVRYSTSILGFHILHCFSRIILWYTS